MWITLNPASKAKEEHNVDFISEMPDEIVCHIISFLPVADAFALKLLSRRFSRIRVPLSNLYFNEETIFGKKHGYLYVKKLKSEFVGKVNSFLKLFKGPYLNAFVVKFCLDHEFAPIIDNWIRFAISMEVESIELDFYTFNDKASSQILYKFPFHLLPKPKSLTRLKRLKLSRCLLDPSPLNFNCLKTIELKELPLDQTSLDRLFSSCLDLELLTVDQCELPSKLIVCSGRLRALRILYCFETRIIVVNSAQLQTFEFYGRSLSSLDFVVVPPLQRVHLGFLSPYMAETFYVLLREILRKLQILSLSWNTANNIPAKIPKFRFLKQLDFFRSQYREFDLLSITNILNVCPLLQKLCVDMSSDMFSVINSRNEKVVLNSETAKYSNLEEIEISGFRGTSNEMEFVKYLLKNAINLKHVTLIYSQWKSDDYKWRNVEYEVLLLMSQKKQFFYDSLRKDMTSREATLIIC